MTTIRCQTQKVLNEEIKLQSVVELKGFERSHQITIRRRTQRV